MILINVFRDINQITRYENDRIYRGETLPTYKCSSTQLILTQSLFDKYLKHIIRLPYANSFIKERPIEPQVLLRAVNTVLAFCDEEEYYYCGDLLEFLKEESEKGKIVMFYLTK